MYKPFLLIFLLLLSHTGFSQVNSKDSSECILVMECEASPAGGLKGWNHYLQKRLNNHIPKQKGAPAGSYTVIVQFTVTKTGAIGEVKALTHHGYGMEEEAVRLVQHAPKWTPAARHGRTVPERRKQPITFTVD